jgi:hypothetical protein
MAQYFRQGHGFVHVIEMQECKHKFPPGSVKFFYQSPHKPEIVP